MDNKATIIMASAIVAILLTSTVANQAFASLGVLSALKGAANTVKTDLGAVRGDLSTLFGGSGGGTTQGGGSGGHR